VRFLAERGLGYPTHAGAVPLVPAAVVYDLGMGDAERRPDAAAGYAACEDAGRSPLRGSVGAGTGCSVGKLLGPDSWTKGGLGLAADAAGEATVAALAVVNAFGDVLAGDGTVLAGVFRDGAYRSTVELLRQGIRPLLPFRESTTLVCVMTDAALDKRQAWLTARAAGTGVARAVDPSATAVDGDVVYCVAGGRVEADQLTLSSVAAHVVAAAIRDAVEQASGLPGCPALSERPAGS
jgi:L-aminopeptidase/D-esterase-like protein